MEPYARFENVQKSYDGDTLVVKDFNLAINHGEFVTLLGPSGSGKTTCLMIMAGFETPTRGQVYLKGEPITRLPPHKRGIGMVFQNYALFPHMSVAENLAFPLQVRKINKSTITEKVTNALDMVQLSEFGDRRPAQLSGGQQQRVALARALVFDPELVLMDEPLGALDKNLREEMQLEIKQIHQRLNVPMLYVTHDQGEALTLSDRIAIFNNGIVQQLSSPDDLYEAPENAFVAQFVGENNCYVGKVIATEANQCRIQIADDYLVEANPIAPLKIGDHSTLAIRPERIFIDPQAGSLANIFTATVRDTIYMGDHLKIRAFIFNQQECVIKMSNSGRRRHYQKGDTFQLGWTAQDCRALDV